MRKTHRTLIAQGLCYQKNLLYLTEVLWDISNLHFLTKIRINIIQLVIWISCSQIQYHVFGLIVALSGHIHLFCSNLKRHFNGNNFKKLLKYFTNRSKAVLLLCIFCVFVFFMLFCVYSLLPCGHMLGKG